MPSTTMSKRRRRAEFDDDGGIVIAEASSSLRHESHRKKARISEASMNKTSSWSRRETSVSSAEEDEVMENQQIPPSPPATQYEAMRDAGFKHLEHTEDDDSRANQRLQARPQRLGDNLVALNAVIESITCINFMCHTRLHCELGPLLNFIVGENGSGKSAILTAITLCLGGKASSTNRGGSLRSFIKEGQEHANLIVKIKNQGSDAYKHDSFGDSIIVERHFTKSGSSGFKLKNADGRIISTKKGDVDDVVDYYCLQVDNPLNVLSQDNARQFLNAASASVKYKYFLQGTQLEQLDNDLQLFSDTIDGTETKIIEHDENVAYLRERFDKAQKLQEASKQNDEMRTKARLYRNQLAWAQVAEQEKILEEAENDIRSAEQEIAEMDQAVRAKSDALDEHDGKIRQAKEALQQVRDDEGQLLEKKEETDDRYHKAKKVLEELHSNERELHEQLKQAARTVQSYQDKIEAEEKRLEDANGGALLQKQKEKDEADQAEQEVKNNITEHAKTLPKLNEDFIEAEKQLKEAADSAELKRKEVNNVEASIRSLSQNRGDPWAGYEPQMRQLVRLVEEDGGFHEKPIGPLGMHIKLTQPKWSPVLEHVLGDSLSAFIVGHREDQQRLTRYAERLKIQKFQVFIMRPTALARLHEPDEAFETVLRVLNFDDERIKKHLIIANRIEQILLVPKRAEAERLMLSDRPPENVAACLALHDHRRDVGVRVTRKRGSDNGSTEPFTFSLQKKPRMKSDSDSQVNLQKEALNSLQLELRDLEAERRRLQQAATLCSQAVTQHKKQAERLNRDLRNAQAIVSRADEALDAFEGVDAKLQGLRDDLQQAEEKKEHYGQQYGSIRLEKGNQSRQVEELKKEVEAAKLDMAEFTARVRKAESKIKRYENLREIVVAEKNQAHERRDMAEITKERALRTRDAQNEQVEQFIQQATEVCGQRVHVPEGESYASIERKYTSIKEQLQKFRNHVGMTEEQINNQLEQATREYRAAEIAQKNLHSLLRLLKRCLTTRLDKWRGFQRMISAHARTNFAYLLNERGFRGQLLLDHQAKKLEIRVEPDETRKTTAGRKTTTLSGGEKSFSSICLLLAIWDAMGSPLRCLDEFDVFMDNVNRAISTNMLVEAARRSVGKQFILITPNAIEGRAKLDKDVKIIRLTDPRQRTLADF